MSSDFDQAMEEMQAAIIEDARRTYSETVIQKWLNPRNMGMIRDPEAYGNVTGPCGDTVKIFMKIDNDRIVEARFLTDGCMPSIAAGCMACELALGRIPQEALAITKELILEHLDGLPEESQHCALLASDAVRAAVTNYLHSQDGSGRGVNKKP
jgi:nitrogen fixation NifU-like protein